MSASLRGKTISFSGAFVNKSDAIARAIKAGAIISPNVSKKIDLLIKGDAKAPLGMKEVVAKYNGTKIVSANNFLNFVQRGGARKVAAATAASTKGRARTVATSRTLKAATAATATAAEEKKAALIETESMEKEAANFGPMPWMKGSKFNSKSEKAAKLKRARAMKAKLALKEAAAAEEVKKVAEVAAKAAALEAAAAPKIVEAAPKAEIQAAAPSKAADQGITFTPSKGLTIQFQGDFSDFCRAASQLVVNKESQSASATTMAEKLPEPTAVVAAPVEAVVAATTAEVTPEQEKVVVVKEEVKSAVVAAPKKKTAGRTRTVVPTRKLAEGEVHLAKKTVSFTGTFFQMKRAALQTLATDAGAHLASGIDSQVDYVVVGADAAHKKKLAKQLGVPTLSEKNFIASASH